MARARWRALMVMVRYISVLSVRMERMLHALGRSMPSSLACVERQLQLMSCVFYANLSWEDLVFLSCRRMLFEIDAFVYV